MEGLQPPRSGGLTAPPPGEARVLLAHGKEAAVFNVQGRLYAVGNRCPHRSGPLFRGRVEMVVDPDAGGHGVERPAVRCPIHGWIFDLETGRCLTRPGAGIPTFPVTCQGEELCVGPPHGEAIGPPRSGQIEP